MASLFKRLRLMTITVLAASLSTTACTSTNTGGVSSKFSNPFSSDDPCANTSRNIGLAIGSIGGAAIGYYTDKQKGATIGAGIGALVGGLIGHDMDKKRCELYKVAQKYQLELSIDPVSQSSDHPDKEKSASSTVLGFTVNIQDKGEKSGHFIAGSDKLTPEAKQYFADIAKIYNPTFATTEITDPKQKAEVIRQAKQKKLLLIGHTDDIGDSAKNAALSEQRAKAVASYLASKGVPENMVYYQGAGETLPIQDNRQEIGRAKNRRVEIVELGSEEQLQTYLSEKIPNYAYYRMPITVSATEENPKKIPSNNLPSVVKTKPATSGHSSTDTVKAQTQTSTIKSQESVKTITQPNQKISQPIAISPLPKADASKVANGEIDLGGKLVNNSNISLDIGPISQNETSSIPFINNAVANDIPMAGNCAFDRPRISGQVKTLSSGKTEYETRDFLPGLYGASWAEKVNGHLIAITNIAILKQGAASAKQAELLIYASYQNQAKAKADIKIKPQVNTYKGKKALLYRVFANQKAVQCIDVALPYQPPFTALGGYIYQKRVNGLFRAPYSPKMANL